MEDLARAGIEEAERLGATYADFRYQYEQFEGVETKQGKVEAVERTHSEGFGVRVLLQGSWGFSCSPKLTRSQVIQTVRNAVKIARASRKVQQSPVQLDDSPLATQNYQTPYRIHPFSIPLDEKVYFLQEAHKQMAKVNGVYLTEGALRFWEKEICFASTQSGFLRQKILESGAEIACYAVKDGEVQRRSYPSYHGGNVATAGFEFIHELSLVENATRIAEEAVALLTADPCPTLTTTLVLGSSQLALQIHESVGHATELDRIFGTEISFAGGSWVKPTDFHSLRYGSEWMNIVSDSTLPRGLGTYGFDDEGVPAQKVYLVQNGILMNALSSRETAVKIGKRSTGAMRADGWNRIPLVRMTNVSLEPGPLSLDALLSDVREGIYMETNKSWSIDDRRLNFQFATEYAREIKNGKLGRLLKNPLYSGITPQFWSSLDGVGDASTWQLWGIPTCGKGQPMQSAHVSHGAPVARFRNVRVTASK